MNGSTVFIFDKKKKILLVKRRDVPIWVVPGGGIEKGETPEEAGIREVEEETGYKIKIIRKVAEYTHKDKRKKNHIFEAKVISGKARLSKESKEVAFLKIDDLPEIRHPSISDWLKDVQKNSKKVIKKEIIGVTIKQALGQIYKHPVLVIRFLLLKMGIHINI